MALARRAGELSIDLRVLGQRPAPTSAERHQSDVHVHVAAAESYLRDARRFSALQLRLLAQRVVHAALPARTAFFEVFDHLMIEAQTHRLLAILR